MRPLNGKCAMTREERNARRRELLKDPFYHELMLKGCRRRWARNKDRRKAERRAKLDAMTDGEREAFLEKRRAKDRARRAARADEANERQRAYYAAHKAKFAEYRRRKRERDIANGKYAARIAKSSELRRKRLAADSEARAVKAAQARAWRRTKKGMEHARRMMEARWAEVVAEGPKCVKNYMAHARPENRRAFVCWYQARLINRTEGLGRIEEERDDQ